LVSWWLGRGINALHEERTKDAFANDVQEDGIKKQFDRVYEALYEITMPGSAGRRQGRDTAGGDHQFHGGLGRLSSDHHS
jgi:hypothetical protein